MSEIGATQVGNCLIRYPTKKLSMLALAYFARFAPAARRGSRIYFCHAPICSSLRALNKCS
jgi:hypothetical protein